MQPAIFVFSFNRGRFLRYCLQTIQTCASGAPIIVFDDGSTDPETRAVLAEIEGQAEVVFPSQFLRAGAKTGGLYNNMNVAFDLSRERAYRRVLFIQDDMQFVRPLMEDDLRRLDACFAVNPDAIQIQTCFFRRSALDRSPGIYTPDPSGFALRLAPEVPLIRANFSAVGLFDVQRFHDRMESLETGEVANSRKARARGLVVPRYLHSFMNWLPYPESYRGRRRSLTHALTERLAGNGFHPIRMMTSTEVEAFLTRDPCAFPVAEDYLHSPTSPRHDIWATTGGRPSLVARGGWRLVVLRIAERGVRLVDRLRGRRSLETWSD